MRKVICLMLLTVWSGGAMADWVIARGDGQVTFYYDPASILKDDQGAKMWILQDFKKAAKSDAGKNYYSLKAFVEFSCAKKQLRGYTIIGYSGKMSKGKVVFKDDYKTPDVMEIPPNSTWESIYNITCRKR